MTYSSASAKIATPLDEAGRAETRSAVPNGAADAVGTAPAAAGHGTPAPKVVIVGGGFSGASVAYHLIRAGITAIDIVEPRPSLGGGLAYSTSDPSHRINVPATRMSLDPAEDSHFARWLATNNVLVSDCDARISDGRCFPQRAVFGRYVAETLAEATKGTALRHVRELAIAVRERPEGGYQVALVGGEVLEADLLVLAVAHPAPCPPALLETAFAGHPRYVTDPWAKDALSALRRDDRVLIVGTGLTMADVVATLDRLGHRGPVTALSRRGLLSRGHTDIAGDAYGDFSTDPSRTTRGLVRRIRATVAEAAAVGRPWQHVFDALRSQGPAIWAALPFAEQKKLVRHLRPFWDVHRFRIAPQPEDVIRRRRADGSLIVHAASLTDARRDGDELSVSWRRRRSGQVETAAFDAVVVTTGPAHGRIFESEPLLRSLADQWLAGPDAIGLGIAVDRESRPISADGRSADGLWIAGPLARGTFGELMGLPEVANHAKRVAAAVAQAALESRPEVAKAEA